MSFYPSKKLKIIVIIFLVMFLGYRIISSHSVKKSSEEETFKVSIAQAKIRSIPIELSTIGTIEPQQSVVIVPQVTGTIKQIYFQSGQSVTAGQLLFEINPATFLANLQQVQSILKRDQAQLVLAEANAKRFASLVKLEYVTKQQYDETEENAQAQAAVVEADEAQVHNAEIQLEYTQIRAPVAGKTGNVSIKLGDLVTAGTATPLVTINQLNPVWVNFNIPQNQLTKVIIYRRQHPLEVKVFSEDDTQLLGQGRLIFIDNNVNAQTGTVLLKAEVPNPEHLLWPGLMVTVRLILAIQHNAIVVPEEAVQLDQNNHFVYRLEQNKAKIQPVIVTRHLNGLAVISRGLTGNEKVITTIPPDLTDGSPIDITHSSKV